MSPSRAEPWGPPKADERGRPPRPPRSGWLVCAVGGCLLVGAVAVQAEVGSVGPIAGALRLPSGATSVTAEPNPHDPEIRVAVSHGKAPTTRDLVTWTTSVPLATVSTAPTRPGATRMTNPALGPLTADDPPPSSVTTELAAPATDQVPTVTTSASSPPASQLPTTTETTPQPTTIVTTTTTTTVAPFDPAQCANPLYYLLHWGRCHSVQPPPPSTPPPSHGHD